MHHIFSIDQDTNGDIAITEQPAVPQTQTGFEAKPGQNKNANPDNELFDILMPDATL